MNPVNIQTKIFLYSLKLIITLPVLFSLGSCAPVTESLYVQDVEVQGPINQPPVRITGKVTPSFIVSPKFFINSNKKFNSSIDGHTSVNSAGVFQVDTVVNGNSITYKITPGANTYPFRGENLHWTIPDYMVGLDLDVAMSKKIALSGGFNLSSKDRTNLYGYRIGLGFFSASGNLAIRFDGGLIWQKYTYDAASVIVRGENADIGSSSAEVIFFRDRGKSTNLNHYLSLTLNTVYDNLPVNFLVNVGYSGQSLIDFEPETPDHEYYIINPGYRVEDMRGEAYAAFINVSPGFYVNLTEWSRLVFAVRFFFEVEFESGNPTFIIPMLQFDLTM